MNFRSKILSGYLVLTLIFSAGVLVCLQALRPIQRSFDRMAVENLPVLNLIHSIRTLGTLLHGEMQETATLLLAEQTEANRAALSAELLEIGRDREQLMADTREYRRMVELYFPEEIEYIPELQAEVERLVAHSFALEQLAAQVERERHPLLQVPLEELEERFMLVTGNIISHEVSEIRERRDQVSQTVFAARYRIGLAYMLSLIMALAIALLLARRISRPVRRLAAAVDLYGRERKVPEEDHSSADEVGELSRAFSRMAIQLNEQRSQLEQTLEQKSLTLDSAEQTLHRQKQQLAEIEQQLAQMQKMEAIGTLAGGIAHDFNNILSGILGYAQMGQRKLGAEHPVSAYLQSILEAGQRAADLTRQILEFSRQSEHQLVALRVEPVIGEALKLLRASLPSSIGIQFECDAEAESACVMADPTQIHQVVMNLCTNALHAMRDEGGLLSVELALVTQENDLPGPGADCTGGCLRVAITDIGKGIRPEELDRIFEPYYTTKERGEGTGMGLAVVHGIIRKYDGRIQVFSNPGQGTRFEILLPVVPPSVDVEGQAVDLIGGSERILLVDDDALVRSMVEQLLVELGYQVSCAGFSHAALQEFQKDSSAYDLVITDMTMPGLSGLELARALLAQRPDIPLILCTGYSDRVDEQQARDAGIAAFVMKPVLPNELALLVRALLDETTKNE